MQKSTKTLASLNHLAALWLLAPWGCSFTAPAGPTSARTTLRIAAASDLQGVLPEVVRRFGRDNPGVDVVPTFGSSGQLARQIREGAPFDLFLAANLPFVTGLADANVVIPASVRPYAVGSLVLAVGPDAPGSVAAVADVTRSEVRHVAIADPASAPYGKAARQALENAGLWDKIGSKLVTAGSVRQAFQFVETGNADAAFVGRALTTGTALRVVEVDPTLYEPIVQGLGLVAASGSRREAEAFAAFLTGPAGQSVLNAFGFKPPPPGPP